MKNIKEEIPLERLSEIATKAIHKLLEDDYVSAMEFFVEELELDDLEKEYFEVPMENERDWDDSYGCYEDDSDRGCADCPPDECTGHCMSCYYRPV